MLNTIRRDISLYRNAYILTFSATMITLLVGWDSGMTGGIIALETFQIYFGLDKKTAAERANFSGNFASIPTLGDLFAGLISAYFFGKFGRKPCLVASAVIHITGSLILSMAGLGSSSAVALWTLYFGRFSCGFAGGLGYNVLSAYISESVPAAIRGRCTGAMQLGFDTGLMLSFWVNLGVSKHTEDLGDFQWRIPFILQIIPGVVGGIAMLFQHESPHWLIDNDRIRAASEALAFTRRTSPDDETISKIIENIRRDLNGRSRLSLREQLKGMKESGSIALQCFIPSLVMFFTMINGTSAVGSFTPQILSSIGINEVGVELFATGIYGVVKVVAGIISLTFVVERFGRKKCLLFGSLGQAMAMLWIAAYSIHHSSGKIVPAGYASIAAIYIFGICYSMGWGPLSYVVMVDVAPYHLRPIVLSIAGVVVCLSEFAVTKLTPIMLNSITYGTYLIYGVCCIIMAAWSYVFLPETTGYSLEDIKYLFERDVILRSLQDSPGGWIFIRHKRATPVEKLRDRDNISDKLLVVDEC